MDDDRKQFPGKKRPGAQGARTRPGGGKPFAKGGGDRKQAPDGKRPYQKRASKPVGAGEDRPQRRFERDRPAGSAAAPAAEGKPYMKREQPAGVDRPYRGDRNGGPKRSFKPRAEGEGGKPYVKRERPAGGDRPFRGDRDGGPKRSFKPRPEASAPAPDAPRFEAGERGASHEHAPRSFGMKSQVGQKRSYGMKSHDEPARKPFRKAEEAGDIGAGERIAKRLARAGIASRRDAEELVAAGRVTVNGRKLDSPAVNVMPDDAIAIDGTAIPPIERTRLFLFNKPAGVVTTNRDPEGRKTVFDVLPADLPRLLTIGRLDINTEGLLLLTNDGGLSRLLELPATGWLRRYRVRVHGKVDEKALAALRDGIAVDGVFYGSVEASLDREQGSNAWLTIGLREGKNREVKNILGALGLEVSRLIRISYGPFQLADLPEGHVLEIKGKMLRDQLGERLIEEAGANFEAPVVKHFSNQPVRRTEANGEPIERPKVRRERIGEGGLIKARKRRENTRDEALGKLSTERPKFERGDRPERPKLERGERPERSAKFGASPDRFASFAAKPSGDGERPKPRAGGKPQRERPPIDPPGARKANVWMAPGARPQGAGRIAAEQAETAEKRARKAGGKPFVGKPREDRGAGDRPPRGDRPGGPRKGGGNADRRR